MLVGRFFTKTSLHKEKRYTSPDCEAVSPQLVYNPIASSSGKRLHIHYERGEGEDVGEYSGTSEKGTLWDQYKFKWFVPFIEVVLF